MQGDPAALRIVERGAFETAECVAAVARRLDMAEEPCEVCPVGGMLQAGQIVGECFAAAVAAQLPRAQVRNPALPPVIGAALLALELADVEVTPEVLAVLGAT
jgi:N-acetylglucosamine kinase-like BadF-type ATPase